MTATEKLFDVLKGEDDLGVIVRTHIHIEAILNDLINSLFREPKYAKKMELDYHQKIKLALAFGLDKRFEKPLNTLGTIRNRFAHRLDSKLGASEVNSLYQSFGGPDKKIMQDAYSATEKKFGEKRPMSMSKLDPGDKFTLIAISLYSVLDLEAKRLVDECTA